MVLLHDFINGGGCRDCLICGIVCIFCRSWMEAFFERNVMLQYSNTGVSFQLSG